MASRQQQGARGSLAEFGREERRAAEFAEHQFLEFGGGGKEPLGFERLVTLGATRVDWDSYGDDPDFVVLADTEGNRFCIVDASHP